MLDRLVRPGVGDEIGIADVVIRPCDRLDAVCGIARLAPQTARMHKRTFAVLHHAVTGANTAPPEVEPVAALVATAYDYADSAEHREGIAAFLAKRAPDF